MVISPKPVAPAPAKGVGIPVAPELLAWLQFLGIVLAGGVLTFRALVTAPAARMLGERERRADDGRFAIAIGAIGAVLALHAVLFGFLVGTYPVVGGSISNLVDTEIIPIRVSTHLGQAFTLSIFAWLVALALFDPAVASGIARISLVMIAFAGFALIVYLSTHGFDRADTDNPRHFGQCLHGTSHSGAAAIERFLQERRHAPHRVVSALVEGARGVFIRPLGLSVADQEKSH